MVKKIFYIFTLALVGCNQPILDISKNENYDPIKNYVDNVIEHINLYPVDTNRALTAEEKSNPILNKLLSIPIYDENNQKVSYLDFTSEEKTYFIKELRKHLYNTYVEKVKTGGGDIDYFVSNNEAINDLKQELQLNGRSIATIKSTEYFQKLSERILLRENKRIEEINRNYVNSNRYLEATSRELTNLQILKSKYVNGYFMATPTHPSWYLTPINSSSSGSSGFGYGYASTLTEKSQILQWGVGTDILTAGSVSSWKGWPYDYVVQNGVKTEIRDKEVVSYEPLAVWIGRNNVGMYSVHNRYFSTAGWPWEWGWRDNSTYSVTEHQNAANYAVSKVNTDYGLGYLKPVIPHSYGGYTCALLVWASWKETLDIDIGNWFSLMVLPSDLINSDMTTLEAGW